MASTLRICIISLCFSLVAVAQSDAQKRAQEELERELKQMVSAAPARVRIGFQGLDEPNYDITGAEFELDGKSVPTPALKALAGASLVPVYTGEVSPGRHVAKARLTIVNKGSVIASDEGGFTWRVAGSVDFDIQAGIEVVITMTPTREGQQAEVAKRFKLTMPSKPVMIAAVDDGKLPAERVRPPKPEPVDAGMPKTAAELAAEAKQKAADDKKKAAEAKKAAAEAAVAEKKAKAEAAAAEKKARADAAAAEKQARAEATAQAKRDAAAAKSAAVTAPTPVVAKDPVNVSGSSGTKVEPSTPASVEGQGAESDAGLAGAEFSTDAGVADVAKAPTVAEGPVDAGIAVAGPPPTDESSFPWLAVIAGGGILAFILFILARRRSNPKIDE